MNMLPLLASVMLAVLGQANPNWRLPATLETLRDVKVGRGPHERGKLDTDSDEFVIKKGERLQMVAIHSEGGCRIRFRGTEYDVGSCYWLEGFADSEADIFKVISGRVAILESTLTWSYQVVSTPDFNGPFRGDLPGFEPPVELSVRKQQKTRCLQIAGTYEAIIDAAGNTSVERAVAVSPGGGDRLARRTIEMWRFQPARFEGKPIRVRIRINISQTKASDRGCH
jgi:hypothetical protein